MPDRLIILLLAAASPIPLGAQAAGWRLTNEVRAGLFTPTRDLGTTLVTTGRRQAAPTLGGSLGLERRGVPVGVYLATTQALSGGVHLRPTPDCQLNCRPRTVSHGRFWTLTAGGTVSLQRGRTFWKASAGGGLRAYAVAGADVQTVPPGPGEMWAPPFVGSAVDPALHLGIQMGYRGGSHVFFLALEDVMAKNSHGRTMNDLLLSAGVQFRRP